MTIYVTSVKLMFSRRLFFIVNYLNHMLVGGASVNSLCQQDGLFALSVNRHSVISLYKNNTEQTYKNTSLQFFSSAYTKKLQLSHN